MKLHAYKIISILGLLFVFVGFTFAQTDINKGVELYQQGKFKEAVKIFEQASKKNKTEAQIWNYLGLAFMKLEDFKKAGKAFENAVKYEAGNDVYHTNLAYAYFLNNKLDKAQDESTKAVKINPNAPLPFYIRGAANLLEGDYKEAIRDADEAIRADANYAMAYVLKSDSLLSTFGKRVGGGEKPIEEVELLRQSKDVLETCLKICQNNQLVNIQRERLDTLNVFYNYFSKDKTIALNQITGVPSAPDPSITPLKILSKPRASYTDKARQNSITGEIRMVVLFSREGRVTHTLILKGLGGGLNENAVRAARAIKFEPARKDGQPISQIRIIEYHFSLY